MPLAALTKVGGLNAGAPASIWPMFSPAPKPLVNAVLAAVAVGALPARPGASMAPLEIKVFLKGGRVKAACEVPGKTSEKMPMPPRTRNTVGQKDYGATSRRL